MGDSIAKIVLISMLSPLIDTLKAAARWREAAFWPVWIATAAAAVVGVVRVVGSGQNSARSHAANPLDTRSPRGPENGTHRTIAFVLFGAVLLSSIVLILTWEDFDYYDNSMFTLLTLKGHNIEPPIWRDEGRFFPLGDQEFDLIRHLTHGATGYHVLPIVELLLLCWVLLVIDTEIDMGTRALIATFVLLSPGIVISFGGLIYPERNLVFALACLLLSVRRFERSGSIFWAIFAVLSAHTMIYYKEPAFLLLITFAVSRIAIRCRRSAGAGWDVERLRDPASRLDLILAGLGGVFVLFYFAEMLPHPSVHYAQTWGLPWRVIVPDYMKLDLLAWLFLVIAIWRASLVVRRKVSPDILWDGVAFGAVVYFFAYLGLHLYAAYYLAPVDLIAILYLGRLLVLAGPKMTARDRMAAAGLLLIVLLQNVSLSAFRVFERKNVIHAKSEIADTVRSRYLNSRGSVTRVFFPFANLDHTMEFAAYLNYRGIPVEGVGQQASKGPGVMIVNRTLVKDGPCVEWETVMCHAGKEPQAGDIVVVLPDDYASTREAATYRDEGSLLFTYDPRPPIPAWLYPIVRHLHVVSPSLPHKMLPDHWLHASVTVWK